MKPSIYRRIRHHKASSRSEGAFFKKENQETFFGSSEHDSFFHSAVTHGSGESVQRKCEKCEEEEKQVQRQPEKKEEEKVMRVEDKKEEKVMKKEDKKEEEKIQRQPEKKEEEKVQRAEDKKEEEKIQKKESGNSNSAGKSVSNYVGSLNGKGNPLPANANSFFSSRMGYDFSNVKIHNDKEASESAKDVNAKAYTIGDNIVFNEGQYNTTSSDGKKLLAHELAHVIQQNSTLQTKIQRAPDSVSDKVSDEDKNIIAAIVATEAFPGHEEDMEWVYIHLYNKNNLNQSTPYRKKRDTYKFNKFLLDGSYKDDQLQDKHFIKECKNLSDAKKDKLCDDLKMIQAVYDLNQEYYDKRDKVRVERIKSELIDKFDRQSASPGYTSNGNLDDLNRDDGEWPMIRQYLIMQDADGKLDKLIKKLGTGTKFEVVYKKEMIVDFFKKNPKKLPKKVPKYSG